MGLVWYVVGSQGFIGGHCDVAEWIIELDFDHVLWPLSDKHLTVMFCAYLYPLF